MFWVWTGWTWLFFLQVIEGKWNLPRGTQSLFTKESVFKIKDLLQCIGWYMYIHVFVWAFLAFSGEACKIIINFHFYWLFYNTRKSCTFHYSNYQDILSFSTWNLVCVPLGCQVLLINDCNTMYIYFLYYYKLLLLLLLFK